MVIARWMGDVAVSLLTYRLTVPTISAGGGGAEKTKQSPASLVA